MYRIATEIEIEAAPNEVWAELTDLPAFEDWNPFMVEASGVIAVGSRLEITLQPPGGSAMTFKPTVTEVDPGRRFEWLGSLGVRGVFDGRHQFELAPSDGGTRLIQSEEFTGLLVPVLKKSLDTKTRAGFMAMNEALKSRLEQRHEVDGP